MTTSTSTKNIHPEDTFSKLTSQREFLNKASSAALLSGHPFPQFAACEAALESTFGASGLAHFHNNLFGMKQHKTPRYGTVMLPSWEVVNGQTVRITAPFVEYPNLEACFFDRINTLKTMSCYADAMKATDGETFVRLLSKHWSTDPQRADKVINIWKQFYPVTVFNGQFAYGGAHYGGAR